MNDPYQDVPPIDVEPMLSDPEDVAPAAPSRDEPKLYYSSVYLFVDEFLTQIYDRSLGTGLTWCSEWWKHTEAVFYLTALWHSWEGLRASGELTAMATWSVQYLYPIMDRLMAENGPFKGCQPDERHRRGEHKDESAPHRGRVLPTTPPPPALVDERPSRTQHGGGVANMATPPPIVRSIGAVCARPRGARPALGRPAHSPTSPTCPVRVQAGLERPP